jgi:hypothetical protein
MKPMPKTDDQYDDEEATKRMNDALRRALTTPPKPQATVRHPRQKQPSRKAAHRLAKPRTSEQ